jgi:uncharacterized membrane protein
MSEPTSQTAEATQDAEQGCCSGSSRKCGRSAREVLDRRYAGGEITREQYEDMKKHLGLTDPKAGKKGCC